MNATTALTTGVGLGLVHFGGLWGTVRLLHRRDAARLLVLGQLTRFALAAAVFYGLSREGAAMVLLGLLGFWLARLTLLVCLGGPGHG
jgi:F1F0 ATPase subunit 2